VRSDMAKVIVERPRHGSRMRGHGKGYRRDRQRIPQDEAPKRERIKPVRGGTKQFNEHLGPLRRYLQSQVGRPWNIVFAEICANISRDSAVQDHVRDHVADYVATQLREIDGEWYYTTRWGQLHLLFNSWRRPLFYVCPKTNLLKAVKRVPRRRWRYPVEPVREVQVSIDYQISFIRKADVWYWVRFEPYPKTARYDLTNNLPPSVGDALQKMGLTQTDAVQRYGRAVVAKEVRKASREEIRKYCEPLKVPNRV
jgi:hypothetical protein